MSPATPRRLLALVCLAAVARQPTDAKVMVGEMQLGSMLTEGYLAKFSFSPTTGGSMQANFTVYDTTYFDEARGHKLNLVMFSDDDFVRYNRQILDGSLCTERILVATWRRRIHPQQRNTKDNFRVFRLSAEVKAKDRAHYYYLFLSDCHLEDYDAHPPTIHYRITMKNGDSHLPADEDGLTAVHFLLLAFGSLAFAGYAKLLADQYAANGQVHLICLFLGTALALQLLSDLCELLHLRRYAWDGKGLRWRHTFLALDFLSEATQGLSELIIALTLLALASGWTLVAPETFVGVEDGGVRGENDGDSDDKARRKLRLSMFRGLLRRPMDALRGRNKLGFGFVAGVTLLQVAMQLLGRRCEGDFNQFHDHEHWPGIVLLVMRIVLGSMFFLGVHASLKNQARPAVSSFLQKLRVAGMAWFLTFPALVFLSPFLFEPYHRHCWVTAVSIVTQIIMLLALMWMTLGNSAYVELSSLGRMKDSMLSALNTKRRRKVCID